MTAPCAQTLEKLFRECFLLHYRTLLRGAAPEPLYQPASWPQHCNRICYREDFFASALHEVAHWCIAGPGRRQLVDYGYWYNPDGRSSAEQLQFEKAECKAQALEWHFALACKWPFRLSNDNLAASPADNTRLSEMVCGQARRYCDRGVPKRAGVFREALAASFDGIAHPVANDFQTTDL